MDKGVYAELAASGMFDVMDLDTDEVGSESMRRCCWGRERALVALFVSLITTRKGQSSLTLPTRKTRAV